MAGALLVRPWNAWRCSAVVLVVPVMVSIPVWTTGVTRERGGCRASALQARPVAAELSLRAGTGGLGELERCEVGTRKRSRKRLPKE